MLTFLVFHLKYYIIYYCLRMRIFVYLAIDKVSSALCLSTSHRVFITLKSQRSNFPIACHGTISCLGG